MQREVIKIKKETEIAEGIFLSPGDMLVETAKGKWVIVENDDEDEDDKKEVKEAEGNEEKKDGEDKEDKKEESKK